jgi:hypothetical protein
MNPRTLSLHLLNSAAPPGSNAAVNHRTSPHRRALIAALLLSVALMQWLGLIHGVVHAVGPAGWHAPEHVRPLAESPMRASDAATIEQGALFGSHDDQAQCRLFDQLAQADLAWLAPPPLVEPPCSSDAKFALNSGRFAAPAASYLARGPPLRA